MSTKNGGCLKRSGGVLVITMVVITMVVITMVVITMVVIAMVVIAGCGGCRGCVATGPTAARLVAAPGYDGDHGHQHTTQC
ncbi:MAG: hypothetical protein P8N76_02400 [Pirellulaceae bacterium]|nr:hypothetical protein [Pirellulaceae bacterium]